MPFDAEQANNPGAPKVEMTPLALAKAQRDRVSSAYHDLQIDHMMLQAAVKDITDQLNAARQRVADLETEVANLSASLTSPQLEPQE